MTDTLRTILHRRVALLTIGLWVAAFGFYLSPGLVLGDDAPRLIAYQALCSIVGATLCFLLYVLVRATRPMALRPRVALVACATLGGLALHSVLDTMSALWLIPPPAGREPPIAWFLLTNMVMLGPVYALYISCVALTQSAIANRDKERRLAAAHAATQEAQLMALRFQINPHFLFNALNAVTALVGAGRNAEATLVVSRLSSFFRASLEAPPGELVRLDEELDVVGSYLDIEAARFGARLASEIDCPDAVAGALVPHFLLQPLVENAIKHGVSRSKATVAVVISAEARGERLVITVGDDALPAERSTAEGAGVGLRNVTARLAALYGDAARLTTGRRGRRFVAEIEMPLAFGRPESRAA